MKGNQIIGEIARAAIDHTIKVAAEERGVTVRDVLSGGSCRHLQVVLAREDLVEKLRQDFVQSDHGGRKLNTIFARFEVPYPDDWLSVSVTGIGQILGLDHSTVVIIRQRTARRRAAAEASIRQQEGGNHESPA